jgi:signal transduction histidine kinase/ligand-binding sensor domain-containing protein/AraC-like DNA-binding protein
MNSGTLSKTLVIYAFFILLCSGGGVHLSAQEYIANVRTFTEVDGLSHNQVRAIHADKDGFIWIATKYGLNRFDGHEFRWFTQERNGLSSNNLHHILEDDSGRLWLIDWEERFRNYTFRSIDVFDPSTFEVKPWDQIVDEPPPFTRSEINMIFALPDGRLIFHLDENHYYIFGKQEGYKPIPIRDNIRLCNAFSESEIWGQTDSQLVRMNLDGQVLDSYLLGENLGVFRSHRDEQGNTWFVIASKALGRGIRITENTRILLLKTTGEQLIADDWGTKDPGELFFVNNPVASTVLLFTPMEVFELDDALQSVSVPISLDEYPVKFDFCFTTDPNGTIWYGHRDGITLFDIKRSKFRKHLNFGGMDASTRGLAATEDRIYVNIYRGGGSIDRRTGTFKSYEGDRPLFKDFRCFPMVQTPAGEIWMANNRLYRLNEAGDVDRVIKLSDSEDRFRIWSFIQTTEGTWWIPKGREGLFYFNEALHSEPQEFKQYNGFEELGDDCEKWCLLEDEMGIWIGTNKGLFLLDEEKGVIAQYAPNEVGSGTIPGQQIYFIHRSPGNGLFLGTRDAGLIQLLPDFFEKEDTTAVVQITRADGMPSNEIYSIYQDDHDHLWLSTGNGLVQLSLADYAINTYFEEEGITHNEFNRLSSFQAESGELFFGGLNGFISFFPSEFYPPARYNPSLTFSSIEMLSRQDEQFKEITSQVRSGQEIVFRPEDKVIRISLSLQDYFFAGRTSYMYKIEGWDENWTETQTNTLQLSGFPYGEFTLRVRGLGPGRQLTEEVMELRIKVLKPFYLQWWFIALALVTLGLSIWQYYYWRLESYRKRQQLLEQLVAERTQKIREDKQLIEEQASQLRELDAVKSRFFANISHELRTPLTLILGPLEGVLNNSRLDNRDYTLLRMMQQNGRQLLKRINELLDLSSLDAGKMDVEQDSVLVYPLLKRILASFEGAANLKTIQLGLDFQLPTELQVLLDTDKVDKILSNYLSNALKFTPKEGTVTLRALRDSNELIFEVADTGIGLRPADQEKVFERFFQSDRNEQVGGSGIGLSLCRELAQLMEGAVWVESELDEGSTFFLRIPLIETFGQTAAQPGVEAAMDIGRETVEENPTAVERDPFRATILVVEDNASLQQYIRLLLAEYRVISAANGKMALQELEEALARGERIRLIISDIMMPVMDGMELLGQLKGNESYQSIPVIMLTAKQDADQKIKALRVGVDDYLTKPFQGEELLARVVNLIERSDQRGDSVVTAGKTVKAANRKILTLADQKWLEEVESLIFDHIGDTSFGIGDMAEQLAMSTRRFQQRIKELTGLTPKAYQREIQLEHARRLLESGEVRSVSEVSYEIGFKDQHYFSQLYKKRFGKMPSEYL